MIESEQEERQRHRRGRMALRLFVLCVAGCDVTFLVAAIVDAAWWRFAVLAMVLVSQVGAVLWWDHGA